MSKKNRFRGVMATTHLDRHGERITREALEQIAEVDLSAHPLWLNWNHQTTLPPIGVITSQRVEPTEDGEYQLVNEGELLGEEDREFLPRSNVNGLDVTWSEVNETLKSTKPSATGHLEITYDIRNYDSEDVAPIIQSLNEIVPTTEQISVRKAEIPPAVIWVFVGFAAGFVARFGEVTADKLMEKAKKFYDDLTGRFSKFLDIKPDEKPDIIFSVPIPDSLTVIEGAVEDADKMALDVAWRKLPDLYAIASCIISRNQKDYFAEMKFLYNPSTNNWDVNFFTTRKTHKVILGPRYYDPSHPLRKRWESELEKMKDS